MDKLAYTIFVGFSMALAVAVILIIDLFINSAMCFAANHWFKLMCLALCACTLVYIGAGRIK